MQTTISDLPIEAQLTSIIALQIDSYGMSQAYSILKYLPNNLLPGMLSLALSLGIEKWVRSMKPYGDPPDPTILQVKHRGVEVCLERHAMVGNGELRSVRSIMRDKMLQGAKELYELGELKKLFMVEQ